METPVQISDELLEELRIAKADFDEKHAIAQEAQARFQRVFVQATNSVRVPKESHLVCLDCGAVYRKNNQGCPTCEGGE